VRDERVVVPVHYDFASTICYVAHRVIARISEPIRELGVDIEWSPVDLAQLCGWPRGAEVGPTRQTNALRVAHEFAVAVRIPPAWLDSRRALAMSLALRGASSEASWRERVWTAVFDEGRAIDEPGELERLARDLELELPDPLGRRVDELDARTRLAAEENVTGAPTFMLGEWPLGGIQQEETLLRIFERYVARRREVS
jgi:predicted DsbA family dithiol-disulfide isomerase